MMENFIKDGFDRHDVEHFINRGLHCREKYVLFEMLNDVKYKKGLNTKPIRTKQELKDGREKKKELRNMTQYDSPF